MGVIVSLLGTGLLAGIYFTGQLDVGQFLTDISVILLTLGLSLLLVQTLIGRNERQERNRKASYPLNRISRTLHEVQDRVVQEYVKYFRDDDLVHTLTSANYADPADALGAVKLKAKESGRMLKTVDLLLMVRDVDALLATVTEDVREASPNLDSESFDLLSRRTDQMRKSFGPLHGIRQTLLDATGGPPDPESEASEPLGLAAGFLWTVTSLIDVLKDGSVLKP
jgi:hypothetical protein